MRPTLHLLVIGTAASSPGSAGQIPEVKDFQEFQLLHPDKQVYAYFIDPAHLQLEADAQRFAAIRAADSPPFCVIGHRFDPTRFHQEYKIMPDDELLLVDYAGIATCEQEWVGLLGERRGWFYWVPGCSGARLRPEEAWQAAHSWTPHTIYSEAPVPSNLSRAHRQSLLVELDKLLLYQRLLPEDRHDPDPPAWLRERDPLVGASRLEDWVVMRKSAVVALQAFFLANGEDFWTTPPKQLSNAVRRILGLISTS